MALFQRFKKTDVIVRAPARGAEQQNELVWIELQLLANKRRSSVLVGSFIVEEPTQEETAHLRLLRRHAPAHGGLAGFRNRADEKIGRRVHPVTTETVATRQFATVGHAFHAIFAQYLTGIFKERVIEGVVHAEEYVGL